MVSRKLSIVIVVIIFQNLFHADVLSQDVDQYEKFKDTIAYDFMEKFNWPGKWWNPGVNSGFASNKSVSTPASAYLYGNGESNSEPEYNWYVLPSIDILNPSKEHKLQFRLSSPRKTSTGTTSGIDSNDYIEIQISTDGGLRYFSELQIKGNNNAYWDFNSSKLSIVADASLDTYAPIGGGDRTLTGDGFSIIEIIIPVGTHSIAVDIFTKVNAAGEEFWFDDFLLLESVYESPFPIEFSSFQVSQVNQDVLVEFTVDSQVDNDYYSIYRLVDGVFYYEKVATIDGDGFSNTTKKYQYLDEDPVPGLIYYCLCQTDNDGGLTSSHVPKPVMYNPSNKKSSIKCEISREQQQAYCQQAYVDHSNQPSEKFKALQKHDKESVNSKEMVGDEQKSNNSEIYLNDDKKNKSSLKNK